MYNYVYPSGIPQLKPNALDTLKTLQTHGVPMCLLTMTRRDALDTVLEYTGMKPFFVFTESTSGQELTKENPEMFIRTANRLGVSPAECIVVEDSLYAIKAAKEAGYRVWAIEDAKHVNDKETIVFTAADAGTTIAPHTSANSIGIPVRISCTAILACSISFGSTGSDCGIQMLFPSRDTEGTAISFMEASIHNAAQTRTAGKSGLPEMASPTASQIPQPLNSRSTPTAGTRRTPRPQFSI